MKHTLTNGRTIQIPDAEIAKLQKILEISKDEAIHTYLVDNDYETDETVEELSEKAKKNIKRYEKSGSARKSTPKTRKVDEEKKLFLEKMADAAIKCGGSVTNIKNEAEFSFNFGENEYTVKLIKHRKSK